MGKRNKFKCIYGLFAPNNSVYIGQTTDPINRKSRYKTLTCKNQRKVFESLKEYGYDQHEFKILHTLNDGADRVQLDYHEQFFYALYLQLGYSLLNLKSAGWNGKPNKESCELMSKSQRGKTPWNAGTKGVCKAWNKGLSISRKSYTVVKNGKIIQIDHLKNFCTENGLNYTTMVHFLKGTGQYENRTTFRGYERV